MARAFLVPVELPADPAAANQAANKNYVDVGLATKAASSHTHAVTPAEGANAVQFLTRLEANLDNVNWLIVGDSTGNATNEWVYLTAQALAAQYPAYTVIYHLWDATGGVAYDTGSAGTPITIQTGTGANTLHVWNCSVSGQNVHYTRGFRWAAAVAATSPHYITVSHGHNEGTTAQAVTPDVWRSRMLSLTESLTELFPATPLAIVLQNPRGDATPDQQRRAVVYREVAALRGYGIIDAQSVFLAQPSLVGLVDADNVHPTTAGSQLWADETVRVLTLTGEDRPRYQGPSLLAIPARNLLTNADFAQFPAPPALPFWTAVNCSPSKDTRTGWVETANGWAVRLQASAAAQTYIYQDIPTGLLDAVRGKYVTLTVRLKVPSGQTATAGRVQVADNTGNYTATTQTDLRDGFHWMTATRKIDAAATYVRAAIYADTAASAGADISVASAHLVIGALPRTAIGEDPLDLGTAATQAAAGNHTHTSDSTKKNVLEAISTKTSAYTLTDSDEIIVGDTTSAGFTLTLPTAVGRTGRSFLIKKIGANTLTIDTTSSQTIDGATTEPISMAYGFREIVSNGANWYTRGGKVDPVISSLANVANAGTISINAAAATIYRVTTTGATATLAVPTNAIDGDQVNVEILANAALSLTINASILLTSGITTPISVAINKRLFLMLRYVGSVGWFLLASAPQS